MSQTAPAAFRRYIAVIDDDPSLCRSLARLLQHAGFQAITFESGEQFLADPLRAHFGCLLVDIQLGGMSGIEMHRRLVADGDRTPVIYITAFDDPRARTEALELGCAGFFRKTDAGTEILETVRKLTQEGPGA
jgi:FixJ family two-component response regulator